MKDQIEMLQEFYRERGSMHPMQEPVDPPDLDPGIRYAVVVLRLAGIETYQSCEGGEGHSFLEPTVQFFGGPAEGWRALAACITHALPVTDLRRVWRIEEGEVVGPNWEITFRQLPVAPAGTPADWAADRSTE